MVSRGCVAEGKNIVIDPYNLEIGYYDRDNKESIKQEYRIDAYGGLGGTGTGNYANGIDSAISSGGGASGYRNNLGKRLGAGAQGTSFSGGAGGGGSYYVHNAGTRRDATDGSVNGGSGGNNGYYYNGSGGRIYVYGGIGNPNGSSAGVTPPSAGTGGSIIIIVKKNAFINSNARITADGSGNGLNGTNVSAGGSSGGGNITIYCRTKSAYNNLNSMKDIITANGGNKSVINYCTGGDGAVRIVRSELKFL